MMELTGISLGKRKTQLNAKISKAVEDNINFDEIISQEEKSDVDKLYKIGVASKYKNVNYIIEIIKSGDSLYMSKALKSIWLYSNDYAHIINPEYLHENIFLLLPLKMTKKLLVTISMHLSDGRAIHFYNYCIRMNYTNIALKFLIFTSESFKLNILTDVHILHKLRQSDELLTRFLGKSFDLAEAYYKSVPECDQANALYQLRRFYSISEGQYLKLLRKSCCHWGNLKRFGLRISKHIIKRHKDEIYIKPMLYLHLLNKTMLVRYSDIEDIKFYVKSLISHEYPESSDFWNKKFCEKYDYILDKIPSDQRLQFIKNIFTDHYPHVEFDMSIGFYKAHLYKLMPPDEREKWALRHIQNDLQLLGSGRDFFWYRFVSFDKAFVEIKKYIQVAENIDVRTEIISVLVESAKTDSDLETLFDYYYEMYCHEQRRYKECFVGAILSEHNIYKFRKSCWNAFMKILYNL